MSISDIEIWDDDEIQYDYKLHLKLFSASELNRLILVRPVLEIVIILNGEREAPGLHKASDPISRLPFCLRLKPLPK